MSAPRRIVWPIAVGLALALPSTPAAARRPVEAPRAEDDEELPLELRVPRMEDAASQLAHARRLKARSFRSKGDEERRFWRTLAIEGYRAVRAYHPEARRLGAEAAFRAGELLRADEDQEAAQTEFEAAALLGADTEFRARARLELGHLARRGGELRAALDRYLSVASDARTVPRHREDAWVWAGRAWWERGDRRAARRAWEGVAERVLDPFVALRAHDELALGWLAEGDLEAAAGQLEACRRSLAPILFEETERGERLVDAYRRMRARERLRAALERRRTRDGDEDDSSTKRDRPRIP